MAKRRVLVTGSTKGSKKAWFFLHFILKRLKVDPLFVHPKSKPPTQFDGLIISGGVDICPKTYGRDLFLPCQEERDRLELDLLDQAVHKELPILGICRGMQLINIYFKGSLYQDISELDLEFQHKNSPLPLKTIDIVPHTKLYSIVHAEKIKANALHHQSIKELGENLQISSYDKNSIIESIEHIDLPILGVQWHPEYLLYLYHHRMIFHHFVKGVTID